MHKMQFPNQDSEKKYKFCSNIHAFSTWNKIITQQEKSKEPKIPENEWKFVFLNSSEKCPVYLSSVT